MKPIQPDQEMDFIDRVGLAAFGILIGGVMIACFIFVLILGSTSERDPRQANATAPEIQVGTTRPENGSIVSAVKSGESGVGQANKPKGPANGTRLLNRTRRRPSSFNKPGRIGIYRTSVKPGKTPKMTEVQ